MGSSRLPRTVHVILPRTERSLCGYEEEVARVPGDRGVVPCPECSALLRAGVLAHRPSASPSPSSGGRPRQPNARRA